MTYDSERFAKWSNADIAAQCRAQARDQLDPEYSLFMTEVAKRLAASPQPPAPGAEVVARETLGPYEARHCAGVPASVCDYGVVSLSAGIEVCRVWKEQDARAISDLLNATPPTAEEIARRAREETASGHVEIAHDGFAGDIIGHYVTREGKRGVVVQQDDTRVVHVYGEKWLAALAKPPGETGAGG
ncbi:MAG: hypothetical protein K0S00_4461 [Xanthobacteraceae bacterium]|jgi:hypothetical protein|nr:hypothetical protein [Xanthobacteraceae bacterium]